MNNNLSNNSKGNITIVNKYMNLIYYSHGIVKKFPKSERFVLAAEIMQNVYKGYDVLFYALKTYDVKRKLSFLRNLDACLGLLKVYVRLSYKYKYISDKDYENWSKIIDEICKMLGGWINSCQKQ